MRSCQRLFGCGETWVPFLEAFGRVKCRIRVVLADFSPFRYNLEGRKLLEERLLANLVLGVLGGRMVLLLGSGGAGLWGCWALGCSALGMFSSRDAQLQKQSALGMLSSGGARLQGQSAPGMLTPGCSSLVVLSSGDA